MPCFNCGGYGHNGYKCKNATTCLKCAEAHQSKLCRNEKHKCPNCHYYNNSRYNSKYDTNHVANDSMLWTILKNKLKRCIDLTDYPEKPVLPRYIGRIDDSPKRSISTNRTEDSERQSQNKQSTINPLLYVTKFNSNSTTKTLPQMKPLAR